MDPHQKLILYPVVVVTISGILGPVHPAVFPLAALGVSVWTILYLPRTLTGEIPETWQLKTVPNSSLFSYAGSGAVVSLVGLAFVPYPVPFAELLFAPLGSGVADVSHRSSGGVFTSGALSGLIWLVLLPFWSIGAARLVRRDTRAAKLVVVWAILLATLIWAILAGRQGAHLVAELLELYGGSLLILFLGGLLTLGVMVALLTAPESSVSRLNEPLLQFLVPGGLGAMNLATIVQGFTGLLGHYPHMASLAFAGVFASAVAVLLSVAFLVCALRGGIAKRNAAHLCLTGGVGLSLGAVFLFVLCELVGLWQTHF